MTPDSVAVAYAGGALLAGATVPQAWRLVRTRDAGGFAWSFTLLNLVGLALLAWRSWTIREWAFLGVNLVTATFWALVLAVKAFPAVRASALTAGRDAPAASPVAVHAPAAPAGPASTSARR